MRGPGSATRCRTYEGFKRALEPALASLIGGPEASMTKLRVSELPPVLGGPALDHHRDIAKRPPIVLRSRTRPKAIAAVATVEFPFLIECSG
jgi:hypothetical protein